MYNASTVLFVSTGSLARSFVPLIVGRSALVVVVVVVVVGVAVCGVCTFVRRSGDSLGVLVLVHVGYDTNMIRCANR